MFIGDDSKSTMENVSMFLAPMGEASTIDVMNVWCFPLCLTGTTFACFTSLTVALLVHGLN